MIGPAVSAKHLTELAAGPALATASALLLVLSQDVEAGGISTQVLTLIASVLASTGVVGYAVKRFVDNQIARSIEDREQDREERKQAHALEVKMTALFEAQIAHWQQAFEKERARNESLVVQVITKNVMPSQDKDG